MVLPVRSVQAVATAREHEAARRAERLLRRIVLPSGVIRLWGPPVSSGSVLLHPGGTVSTLTKFAYRHAFWSVRLPLSSVDSFVKAHPTAGLKWMPGGSTQGPGVAANAEEDFHGQLVGGRPMQRLLSITMARLNGTTVIRVDAGAAWVYPRSPREVVPSGVHEIDIANSTASRRVTNPAKVPRIIRWFDMLSIVQPGVRVGPLPTAPRIDGDVRVSLRKRRRAGERHCPLPARYRVQPDCVQHSRTRADASHRQHSRRRQGIHRPRAAPTRRPLRATPVIGTATVRRTATVRHTPVPELSRPTGRRRTLEFPTSGERTLAQPSMVALAGAWVYASRCASS